MTADVILAKNLGQLVRDPFGQAPRVDEHQGAGVLVDQFDDSGVDFSPLFVRADGREITGGNLDLEVEVSLVADVNHRGFTGLGPATDKKIGSAIDRLLGGRESDALKPGGGQCFETFDAQRQVAASLVANQCMDFINDQRVDIGQRFPGLFGREHQVQ